MSGSETKDMPVDPFALFADDHIPPCVALEEACRGRCETLALVHQVGRRLYLRIEDGLGLGETAGMLDISLPELFGLLTGSLAYTSAVALNKAAAWAGIGIPDPARVERCFLRVNAHHTPASPQAHTQS